MKHSSFYYRSIYTIQHVSTNERLMFPILLAVVLGLGTAVRMRRHKEICARTAHAMDLQRLRSKGTAQPLMCHGGAHWRPLLSAVPTIPPNRDRLDWWEPIAAAPVKENVIINLLEPVTLEHLSSRTTVLLPVANFILTSSNLSNPV